MSDYCYILENKSISNIGGTAFSAAGEQKGISERSLFNNTDDIEGGTGSRTTIANCSGIWSICITSMYPCVLSG